MGTHQLIPKESSHKQINISAAWAIVGSVHPGVNWGTKLLEGVEVPAIVIWLQ